MCACVYVSICLFFSLRPPFAQTTTLAHFVQTDEVHSVHIPVLHDLAQAKRWRVWAADCGSFRVSLRHNGFRKQRRQYRCKQWIKRRWSRRYGAFFFCLSFLLFVLSIYSPSLLSPPFAAWCLIQEQQHEQHRYRSHEFSCTDLFRAALAVGLLGWFTISWLLQGSWCLLLLCSYWLPWLCLLLCNADGGQGRRSLTARSSMPWVPWATMTLTQRAACEVGMVVVVCFGGVCVSSRAM